MRIDPETVYLELLPGSTSINFKTGATRRIDVVRLHFKPDPSARKWVERSFVGDSLAEVLDGLAALLREHDLPGLLEIAERKKAA